jgi:GNAT superfamily N-acetyltransferase
MDRQTTPMKNPVPGALVRDKDTHRVMGLLSAIFDPVHAQFSWKDHLPGTFDTVWSWSLNGHPVSALLTRAYQTYGVDKGLAIGMVGTDPTQRGKGYSSLLLHNVLEAARHEQNSFAVLWTREHLLDFYSAVGFTKYYPEFDCLLSPESGAASVDKDLQFSEFNEVSHQRLESMRCAFNASALPHGKEITVRRHVKGARWIGISASRGCRFGILYQGSVELSPFYAVVAYDGPDPIIVEFVGSDEAFRQAINWIYSHLKSVPISYSVTAPHLQTHISAVHIDKQETNYYTMICRLDSSYQNTPLTTWLDRI